MTSIDEASDSKEIVKGFCEETTMHGLKYFSARSMARKIVWTLLVIAGFVLVVIQVRQQFDLFLSNPISTSIDMTFPTSIRFPSIMICNSNMFRIQKAYKKKINDSNYDLFTYVYASKSTADNSSQLLDQSGLLYAKLQKLKNKYGNDMTGFFNDFGHKLEDMLLSCKNVDGTTCTSNNFQTVLTEYGKCYVYNTDSKMMVTQPGVDNSLTIYLNLATYEAMLGPVEQSSLKVMITGPAEKAAISKKGIDAPPGYMSIFGINYQEQERILESSGGSCIDNVATNHYTKEDYNAITCQLDQDFNYLEKQCKCSAYYAPKLQNLTTCNIDEHFACILQTNTSSMKKYRCSETCNSSTYTTSLSLAKITKSVMNALLTEKNEVAMMEEFTFAMEAFARTDVKEVNTMMNVLLKNVLNSVAAVVNEGIFPNITNMKTVAERLTAYPIYGNYIKSFSGITSAYQNSGGQGQGGGSGSSTINGSTLMNGFSKVLTTNQQTLFNSSDSYEVNDELATDIFSFWESLRPLMNNPVNTSGDPDGTLPFIATYYEEILKDIDKYIAQLITKKTLSGNSNVPKFGNDFSAEYCDPFNTLKVYTEQIIAFLNVNITQIAFDHLNESVENSSFWLTMNYAATAKFKLNLDQSCTSFESNFEISSSSTPGMQQPKMQNCTIPNNMTYYRDFFWMWYKNHDLIVNESLSLLNKIRGRLCQDLVDSFNDLAYHLKIYKKRWDWDDKFYSNNILGVKIYFSDLSVESVTQSQTYDFFTLICDIGGSLGLFLGASILTFFEFLDMIVVGTLNLHKKK